MVDKDKEEIKKEEIKKAVEEKKKQIYISQKRKEKMIKETTERRGKSIKESSTQRDAVLIYTTFIETFKREPKAKDIERAIEKIMEIKEWLSNIYEVDRKYDFLELKDLFKRSIETKPVEEKEKTKQKGEKDLPF